MFRPNNCGRETNQSPRPAQSQQPNHPDLLVRKIFALSKEFFGCQWDGRPARQVRSASRRPSLGCGRKPALRVCEFFCLLTLACHSEARRDAVEPSPEGCRRTFCKHSAAEEPRFFARWPWTKRTGPRLRNLGASVSVKHGPRLNQSAGLSEGSTRALRRELSAPPSPSPGRCRTLCRSRPC